MAGGPRWERPRGHPAVSGTPLLFSLYPYKGNPPSNEREKIRGPMPGIPNSQSAKDLRRPGFFLACHLFSVANGRQMGVSPCAAER